jgi:hypothetical protein
MDKNKKHNFKKLLCYNIVNNMKCVYKNKCMFAHDIEEQLKEPNREFIYNMIYLMSDLSNINIKDNKELFEDLLIFTKECKNCINKKCPGGYNCKFGVCIKNLKICYNDLLSGKCCSNLEEENVEGKIIKRCSSGIHLTEKNLIPYYQRVTCEISVLDYGVFLFNNVNYYSKINTVSVMLNDNTIKFIKNFINKNKIYKSDLVSNTICEDKFNFNYLIDGCKNKVENNLEDNDIFEDTDLLEEYKREKDNEKNSELNNYFWRYNNLNFLKNNLVSQDEENNKITNNTDNNANLNNDISIEPQDINEQIKSILKMINEIDCSKVVNVED